MVGRTFLFWSIGVCLFFFQPMFFFPFNFLYCKDGEILLEKSILRYIFPSFSQFVFVK